ncbi:hypothetical protein D3C81_1849540 [compost metagenome]
MVVVGPGRQRGVFLGALRRGCQFFQVGERSEAFEYVRRMREAAPDDPRLQAVEPYWKQ